MRLVGFQARSSLLETDNMREALLVYPFDKEVQGSVAAFAALWQTLLQRDMVAEPLAPRGTTPFHDGPPVLRSGLPGLVCASGDSFVTGPDPWFAEQNIDVVDMELFAIAAACARKGVAWRALKFISDDANTASGTDWAANVRTGAALFLAWWQHNRSSLAG